MLSIRQSINKAYLRLKPDRPAIETFKRNFIRLLDHINPLESEEFHKNLVISFLKDTWYGDKNFINTKGKTDLVIHLGKEASSKVGVIVEVKKPANKFEMVTRAQLNAKALQELLLYYLRERITGNNLEVKHLIITNIHEWFVFDAHVFEKCFINNKLLIAQFVDFDAGRLAGNTTDFFYTQIASPAITKVYDSLTCTWFDIREFDSIVRNADRSDDVRLIPLFKFYSAEHLLKLPFANDSNSLDRRFYTELLHLIGLEESKVAGKKLIGRKHTDHRNPGSLLENTITILTAEDRITNLEKPFHYGSTRDEQLYQVGLELVITWINRILFLKLLEGQLLRYHKGDPSFRFLSSENIPDFDALNKLFFQVLAVRETDRTEKIRNLFHKIPYLNSSLFEPSAIERKAIFISNLDDDNKIPVHGSTVLKNSQGKRTSGDLNTLGYLFAFLDAYDFTSEGSEEIQEENKSLINASVLGLIFEKINGYKDGSFYTPGFITMYMCRETLRRAVVQKFNELKSWDCLDMTDLYNRIDDRLEANTFINELKICDPAVGSGHFLVSALNELIAIKSELGILVDSSGRKLKEYHVEVINDELVIIDEDGRFFEYRPGFPESQRVQETLFKEKQTLIENCLFGVDINPNSVKICRLRLWIELLKNAFYKADGTLETLPNIDINIKCGNSLVSRYPLDADIRQALKGSKWTVQSYRMAVMSYRNARSKEEKREMETLIDTIKKDFESEVADNDRRLVRRNKLKGELDTLTGQGTLWDKSKKELDEWNKKLAKLTEDFKKVDQELSEIHSNKIFENAFEWRFEFPEVLDHEGNFKGFDVVIGNPPYIRQEEITSLKPYLEPNYQTFSGTADIYVYFIEQGLRLLKDHGDFIYIVANKWMRAGYGKSLREYVANKHIMTLIDFEDLPVFEEATTYPCIFSIRNSKPSETFNSLNVESLDFPTGLEEYFRENHYQVKMNSLSSSGWVVTNDLTQRLLEKIRSKGIPLSQYVDGKIYRGVLTGLNEAFVIDAATRHQLIRENPTSAEIIKPFLAGRDIKRYRKPQSDKFLIFTRRGISIDHYPAILNHLKQFKESLEPKPLNYSGSNWQGRKSGSYKWYEIQDAVDYYEEFEKPKIIYPNICKGPEFTFDTEEFYTNQKCFIIGLDDKYLLGVLNSRLFSFLFSQILPKLRGDFYEPSYVYLKDFPIFSGNHNSIKEIEKLAFQLVSQQDLQGPKNLMDLNALIDKHVYDLYDLTEEEIAIVNRI